MPGPRKTACQSASTCIIFFLMIVLRFASMGTRLPGPSGAAAARFGFALRSPRVGYGLPTAGAPNQF